MLLGDFADLCGKIALVVGLCLWAAALSIKYGML